MSLPRALALLALLAGTFSSTASVTVFPKPPEEADSADYQVFVRPAGSAAPLLPVPVYGSFQFAPGSPATLWGRPVSPLSFCSVDADEPVEITVRFLPALAAAGLDLRTATLRPLSLGLHPAVAAGAQRVREAAAGLDGDLRRAASGDKAERARSFPAIPG